MFHINPERIKHIFGLLNPKHSVRGTAWYSLATRGLVFGGGVGGGVGRMVRIDFLVFVLRQEGTRRVRMGSFWLLRVLLIYSSLLSHVTPTGKLIYAK